MAVTTNYYYYYYHKDFGSNDDNDSYEDGDDIDNDHDKYESLLCPEN